MNFAATKASLLWALGIIEPHCGDDIMLETGDGYATVTGSNFTQAARAQMAAAVSQPGRVILNAETFVKSVKGMPADDFSCIVAPSGGNKLEFKSGKAKFTIPYIDKKEGNGYFGPLDAQEGITAGFTLSGAIIQRALTELAFCVSKDITRFYLSGTHWSSSAGKLELVATDAQKLAWFGIGIPVSQPVEITVPSFSFPKTDEEMHISISDQFIRFEAANFSIASKLIDGQFPDWRRLIPDNRASEVKVNRAEFSAVVDKAAAFISARYGSSVQMRTIDDEWLEVCCAGDNGEFEELIRCDGSLPGITLAQRHLGPVLSSFSGSEMINMKFKDSGSPVTIGAGGDKIAVIYPMADGRWRN